MTTALIVIDVQLGFDSPDLPPRNNPSSESNIRELVTAWQAAGEPIVLVRHDSLKPESPLRAGTPGNAFKPELDGVQPTLMFTKNVNSAFHGHVDLKAWLDARGIKDIVVIGIQTNWCVETTARVGGNLGYHVRVAIDATHTYDATTPDGAVVTADELSRATAANLHSGGFAEITSTKAVLASL
ncbi:cysteine hydrolase family protein [Actinocrispum sp. NPDC049592]|uniref:cysteine hydrolase family protein n=1 Tax=Actinocrispum sp. NPDC049592 TaxID=3154835 RepID=UPI003441414A